MFFISFSRSGPKLDFFPDLLLFKGPVQVCLKMFEGLLNAFLKVFCDLFETCVGLPAIGTNMLQGPLVQMTFDHLSGNFRPLLIGSLALNAPLPLLWIGVSIWRRKISQATVQLESGTRPLNQHAESSSAVN